MDKRPFGERQSNFFECTEFELHQRSISNELHYPSSLTCKSWGGFAARWTGSQMILGIDQCLITVVVI